MPNYPTSVPSFTNKSAGQTIASAHMNAVQDEVVAIGGGLLQGSARLNSSHSTVAALSVTGGSTFTVRSVEPPPDLAVVYIGSTLTLGSSAFSTVAFVAQDILTNSSMHSTASNAERLTPQSTGVYRVAAQIGFSGNSSGNRLVALRDSSGAAIATNRVAAPGSDAVYVSADGFKRFDVLGGYVTCQLEMNAASTLSLSTGIGISWFALQKL